MPTYHFNVFDHLKGTSPDWAGTELADIAAVRREALRFAGETLIDASAGNRCVDGWRVEVTDHTGQTILSLGFVLDFRADAAPKEDHWHSFDGVIAPPSFSASPSKTLTEPRAMQKTFRAVPLSDITSAAEAVSVIAENGLAALLQAKEMLGDETPFDLCEGARLVAVYRPTRTFGSVRLEPKK